MADLFYVDGKGTRNPVEASIFNEERGLKVCIVDAICEKNTQDFIVEGVLFLGKMLLQFLLRMKSGMDVICEIFTYEIEC